MRPPTDAEIAMWRLGAKSLLDSAARGESKGLLYREIALANTAGDYGAVLRQLPAVVSAQVESMVAAGSRDLFDDPAVVIEAILMQVSYVSTVMGEAQRA